MNTVQLFPFEFVSQGSRIVIYGLGAYGKNYIEQIKTTHWCEIVAVTDKNLSADALGYVFCQLDKLIGLDCDYVVIALKDYEDSCDVYSKLKEIGIEECKIVSSHFRERKLLLKDGLDNSDTGPIKVMYLMRGGIGDAVMELALYERLVELVPDIVIDMYGESYCASFWGNKANIRDFYDYHVVEPDKEKYDLFIEANWGIRVWNCNKRRIKALTPELYKCIEQTEKDIRYGGEFLARIQKGRLAGRDRFQMMGRGDIWNLSSDMIHIDLDKEVLEQFEQLCLRKYITVNCGADNRKIQSRGGQGVTKVWPLKYFGRFVNLIKKKYPEIEVVQIGGEGQEAIEGVDRAILGESLELAKYILKNSLLHIDDEGGLMHLATALGTKCVVLFGPTPMDILGYPQNINISANVCQGCFGAVDEWWRSCYRGFDEPPCMYSITPEMVMEKVEDYLQKNKYM